MPELTLANSHTVETSKMAQKEAKYLKMHELENLYHALRK
jgi:hypothetical protein